MSGTRNDPAWEYCQPIPNNKNGTICTFCGHIMQSGGITRFKFHLSGKRDVQKCKSMTKCAIRSEKTNISIAKK